MRKAIVIFAAAVTVASVSFAAGQENEAQAPHAKNVILLIGDGMGFNHVDATSIYKHGRTGGLIFEGFPVKFAVSTYPAGGGYDGEKVWGGFDYVKKGATDSAAAATALATGAKTYNGAIGVGEAKAPLGNVVEAAEALGKSTGVVSSVMFSHATPAGFVAHNEDRDNYADIALEMLERSSVDVIMGVGHPLYDDDGRAVEDNGEPKRYTYVGGKDEWERIVSGKAGEGSDADHNGIQDDAWTFVEMRGDFQKMVSGTVPKRVVGIPRIHAALQNGRSGRDDNKKDDKPFETPLVSSVPTLAEMTAAAINVLDGNEKGFLLMVEGGSIDGAAHSNVSGRVIEETLDFEGAVEAVVAWVEKNSNWDETLVIVTADHETGYLTGPQSDAAGQEGRRDAAARNAILGNGGGKMPQMEWHSGGHTNSLVPLYARGRAAALLEKYADETDVVRGRYVDNTEIAAVIFEAIGERTPAVRGSVSSESP